MGPPAPEPLPEAAKLAARVEELERAQARRAEPRGALAELFAFMKSLYALFCRVLVACFAIYAFGVQFCR